MTVQVEFELAYFKGAVQHFSYYAMSKYLLLSKRSD